MDESFVVGLKRDEILRRRSRARRTQLIGSGLSLLIVVAGFGFALVVTFQGSLGWPVVLLLFAAMLMLCASAIGPFARREKLRRWAAGTDLPPYALRMTHDALELGVEGASAPIVLPWPAVLGFQRKRKLGQPLLQVAVQPGAPGLNGQAGVYSVAALDQPVEAIDQALRYFSNGVAAIQR